MQTLVGIDVLVGGEEDPVAVAAAVGEVGEDPEAEQVGGGVERQPSAAVEALTRRHLLGDGTQQRVAQAVPRSVATGHAYLLATSGE